MNLHHSEWTAGLVALFHRFEVSAFAWDVQEVRHLRSMLRMGVDALYCDRVDRMVATVGEWGERATWSPGRRPLQESEVVERPDAHEDAADDRRLLDRPEEPRVLRRRRLSPKTSTSPAGTVSGSKSPQLVAADVRCARLHARSAGTAPRAAGR